MTPADRYYVQTNDGGVWWAVYDRRTPSETNCTGHACQGLISCRMCAENESARLNSRPLPHHAAHRVHSGQTSPERESAMSAPSLFAGVTS